MIQGKYCSFSYPSRSSSSIDLTPSPGNGSGGAWGEECGLRLGNSSSGRGADDHEREGGPGILFVDPSGRNDKYDERGDCSIMFEKEHMFDKVVTPSDVGKLNRLVIPKQHAEKYFPLDSSNCEKGLLLNFEDRTGKPWRFRYSYWNSSQSYVMTKGWSRFVKEMKLDAGDIVSFQRGVGELGKDRLFIDWRRRHHPPEPPPIARNHLHLLPRHVSFGRSIHWDSLAPQDYQLFPRANDGSHIPHRNSFSGAIGRNYDYGQVYGYDNTPMATSRPNYGIYDMFYLSSSGVTPHMVRGDVDPRVNGRGSGGRAVQPPVEIFESVPVAQVKVAPRARKFRLFGVNMECSANEANSEENSQPPSTPDLMLYDGVPATPTTQISSRGKGSMSLDLDI
ncbi:hypothetical protein MLD38_019135 [Melastoma candidum]|uniref:Uncharacterized protein n=1 Tax=Melastoma candidum TaxID=119954 RepID=A0ACB9QVZ9_9MYRT|nr:hypothetical protein MLD38_019135 [Melastoma candidum]